MGEGRGIYSVAMFQKTDTRLRVGFLHSFRCKRTPAHCHVRRLPLCGEPD